MGAGGVWGVSGACLGRVWGVSGACLGRVWGVSGACLGGLGGSGESAISRGKKPTRAFESWSLSLSQHSKQHNRMQ